MATKDKAQKKAKLRHAEYYDFQEIQDELYADSLKRREFKHLVEIISLPENIRLAYRNIKANHGSKTAGTDGRTIKDLEKLSDEKLVALVQRKFNWYEPQSVRRVEIPKGTDPAKTRPLGIPTILDRLIQQCVLQVLEPICEAKFHEHSYGFRPNRSQEHAIALVYKNIQLSHYCYVVDIDIKGFFDNVNHGKLLKQMWTLGIRDKKLLSIVSAMLKAEVAGIGFPEKGTPQGGIISPLLSNIVLNELDWWIASQWEEIPTRRKYAFGIHENGTQRKSGKYAALRNTTHLKEVTCVRYLGNAATGVIFPITVIGWGVSLFFGDGAAASLSVSLGKNETENIHRSVGNSILFSFLGGVVIILISYLWGDGLLRLIGATDANLSLAHDYGFIIYAMMPLALVQNTLASIIRADGSPKYAMGAMLVGAVLNIIGDPVAIFVLDMGIKGAAYATILGQFVSFCICAAYLTRSKAFRVSASSFRPDPVLLKQVMALGASSFLTQLSIVVITVINNILLVKYGAVSDYGADIPLAAFVVIMKLFQIVLNIAIGIAAGAQPIVGYNYGAKKFKRVRELLGLIIKWTAIVCLICTILFEAFPLFFIQMFGADGELYTQFAVQCLRIYLSLILFTCVQKVCAIFLQSIGHAKAAAPLSILRDVLLIVFSIAAPMVWGVTGIFWAAPIADVLAIAVTAVVMLRLWNQLKAEDVQPGTERPVLQSSRPGVIITIAREHGTAGKRIGQLVAQKLGIPCYYKEMTALAAQESGLAKEFISGINSDENAIMRELYLSTSVVQQAVIAQGKAINMIADAGSCVIVGRAADYVLRNRENVVRIFIHAPKDYRVKKVMEMYGDTEQEGRKSIARSDSARGTYYKSISGHVWGDPHQYELSVDSSIGPEKTAELICGYISRM